MAQKPISKCIDVRQMTVYIGDAPAKLTKRVYRAKDVADVFKIDTTFIADFEENAIIEKVVVGPPDVEGKWDLCSVIMAFAPTLYSKPANVKKALAKTSIANYPSRKELEIPRYNVSLLFFCTINTNLYQGSERSPGTNILPELS